MLAWLLQNWGWLVAGMVLAAYFAFYVLAMREQHSAPRGKSSLPCDRC
jgi:hypothetical protein